MFTPNAPQTGLIVRLCLATSLAWAPLAHAVDKTWNGGTDSSLSNSLNWGDSAAPASGDAWIFGTSGTGGYTLNNNLTSAGFNVGGITFGAGTTAYTISGNAFTLTGNITNNGNVRHTISSNITINGATVITQNSSSGNDSFGITLAGNLSGSGSITQNGASAGTTNLYFSGDNSGFTGAFTASNQSSVRTTFQSASAGSASASWTFNRAVNGGVGLGFANGTISFGALSGSGFIRSGVNGTATVSVGALNTNTTFSGKFQQGSGTALLKLEKVGTGTLLLTGANEHLGGTIISGGTLLIGANNVLADAGKVILNGGSLEIGGGFSDTVGTLGLESDSIIKLGLGSSLVFADSSSLNWNAWNLTLDGEFVSGSSLRFGTTTAGLTEDQLGQITMLGYTNFSLNSTGFLVAEAIPEPAVSALVLLAGGAMLIRWRQAKRPA